MFVLWSGGKGSSKLTIQGRRSCSGALTAGMEWACGREATIALAFEAECHFSLRAFVRTAK